MRVISPIANGKGPTHHWVELSDAAAAWSCIIATAVQTATVASATHNTLAVAFFIFSVKLQGFEKAMRLRTVCFSKLNLYRYL